MRKTTQLTQGEAREKKRKGPRKSFGEGGGFENNGLEVRDGAAFVDSEGYVNHKALLKETIAHHTPFPEGRFNRDGIVICAGGVRYFTCAWVCIRTLRALGCKLPIQIWHLGRDEMSEKMSQLVEPYDVTPVDAVEIRKIFPVRTLNGWELKPFSIIHSPFERVLLLDADVVPVVDPTFLFSCPEFQESGAIFWPDYGRLENDREIWDACGVAYRDEPEFESGQIVVDKRRCWKALQVAMYLNEYSDFYYNLIHGDKETFHMGFLCTDTPYAMPWRGIDSLEATMCQHDFNGGRLFQHRNMAKWDLYGDNIRIDGFLLEEECIGYIEELLRKWDGYNQRTPRYSAQGRTKRESACAATLIRYVYKYVRLGYDERPLTFLKDGRIGEGRQRCEAFWDVTEENGDLFLRISGADTVTCVLRSDGGTWVGEWLDHEQMPVALEQTNEEASEINPEFEDSLEFSPEVDSVPYPLHLANGAG